MMKKAGILGLALATFLMVSPAGATTVGITDSQNGWTVDYSLTYALQGSGVYDAALTITTSLLPGPIVNGPWVISDVAFKFYDGSPVITITPEGVNVGSMGTPWNPHDGFYGFTINGGAPGGFPINSGSITYDFDFSSDSLVANTDFINFFVDYTGGVKNNGGNFQTNLSSYLAVPEPGTILLLGSGLLGFAVYRRRVNRLQD